MLKKKNLLIYAHYYIPDTASTGQILRELAEGMLDKFNITVICVVPSYLGTIEDKYKTQKYYEEEINGVKVLRIRVPEFSKTNKKSRVKNIVSYFIGAMGATFKVGKMDYVFSISQPPILGGLLGVWGKWMKHAKYIYNIQDFNPEQVLAVGYTKSKFITDAVKNLPYIVSNVMALLTCLPMAIGIMVFGKSFSGLFENKMLATTGMISYEIYLVHAFTLGMIKPSVVSVIAFVVVTVTLAYATYFTIGKMKNGRFNNYYPHKE